MDEADQANDNIARDEAIAIKVTANRGPEVDSTGVCLYCTEELTDGRRWCDADCRNAWQVKNRGIRRYL